MGTSSIRVINTPDLLVLWRKAGPGKRPGAQFMNRLDPEGLHTLQVVLPFMNDGAEHRLMGYAKVEGTDEPVEFEIDMLTADFNRLRTADSVLAEGD